MVLNGAQRLAIKGLVDRWLEYEQARNLKTPEGKYRAVVLEEKVAARARTVANAMKSNR